MWRRLIVRLPVPLVGLSAGVLGLCWEGPDLWLLDVPLLAWAPAALSLTAWALASSRPAWLSRSGATRAILWSALPASLLCVVDAFGPTIDPQLDVRELVAAGAVPAALVALPRAGAVLLAAASSALYLWCGLDPWWWDRGSCLFAESLTALFGLPLAVALGTLALAWARPFGRFLVTGPKSSAW